MSLANKVFLSGFVVGTGFLVVTGGFSVGGALLTSLFISGGYRLAYEGFKEAVAPYAYNRPASPNTSHHTHSHHYYHNPVGSFLNWFSQAPSQRPSQTYIPPRSGVHMGKDIQHVGSHFVPKRSPKQPHVIRKSTQQVDRTYTPAAQAQQTGSTFVNANLTQPTFGQPSQQTYLKGSTFERANHQTLQTDSTFVPANDKDTRHTGRRFLRK